MKLAMITALFLPLLSAQKFEVASVRPHEGRGYSQPVSISGPNVRLEGYTVFGLILEAYGVKDYQLSLGRVAHPEDVYDTRYDIAARASGPATPAMPAVRVMLQDLLAERFQIAIHRESNERPVYDLAIGKRGLRLMPSTTGAVCSVHSRLAKDGRNDEDLFSGCGMDALAGVLTHLVEGRPVVDRTGTTAKYDFRLIATPEDRGRTRSDPADISIPSALEDLGLKLSPGKAQIEVIVVDHVGNPTEN